MADDSIDISVDPDVSLIKHGNLYKTTVGITVGAEEPYGFNISMQAADSSLSNSIDKSHKITSTQSDTPVELGANQWGYALDSNAGKFSKIPSGSDTNIVDVTKDNLSGCKSVKFCTKRVTYAANIDAAKLSAGNYSTSITYTATAKAAPAPAPTPPAPEPYVPPTPKIEPITNGCGDGHCNISNISFDDILGSCKTAYVYAGGHLVSANWDSSSGEWYSGYDYNYSGGSNNKWAYAIVVDSRDLCKRYANRRTLIIPSDIAAIYAYVPRYRVENNKVIFNTHRTDYRKEYGVFDSGFQSKYYHVSYTGNRNGFWIALKAYEYRWTGKGASHGICNDNSSIYGKGSSGGFWENETFDPHKYHMEDKDASEATQKLIDIIGSPCPK